MSEVSIEKILEDLKKQSCFSNYKFRKRDTSFIKKSKEGTEIIELQLWKGYDLNRDNNSIIIKPLYLKRFNILHEWFEKFSFKTIKDQKDNFSIGFDGGMLNAQGEFHFLLNGNEYNSDFELLVSQLKRNSELVFGKYYNIYSLYEYFVEPIINQDKNLPNNGADWIFEYLTLTKIVQPNKFETLYHKLKGHMVEMYKNGEPNVSEYYNEFDEIINYLKKVELNI